MPDVRLVERNYHVSREVHSSNACSTEWRSSKMFGRVAVEVIVGASSSELAGLELLLFLQERDDAHRRRPCRWTWRHGASLHLNNLCRLLSVAKAIRIDNLTLQTASQQSRSCKQHGSTMLFIFQEVLVDILE